MVGAVWSTGDLANRSSTYASPLTADQMPIRPEVRRVAALSAASIDQLVGSALPSRQNLARTVVALLASSAWIRNRYQTLGSGVKPLLSVPAKLPAPKENSCSERLAVFGCDQRPMR